MTNKYSFIDKEVSYNSSIQRGIDKILKINRKKLAVTPTKFDNVKHRRVKSQNTHFFSNFKNTVDSETISKLMETGSNFNFTTMENVLVSTFSRDIDKIHLGARKKQSRQRMTLTAEKEQIAQNEARLKKKYFNYVTEINEERKVGNLVLA